MRLGFKSAFLASVALGVLPENGLVARLPEHDKAVQMARNNDPKDALKILEKLHQEHPNDQDITNDLVTVALWAGDDKKAREIFFSELSPQKVPLYVLESAAKASRNLGNIQEAQRLYEIGQKRDPKYKAFQDGLNDLDLDRQNKEKRIEKRKATSKPKSFLHPEHQKALDLARAGHNNEAVDLLAPLHYRFPQDKKITNDLVVLAMWADQNEFAREIFFQDLSLRSAPLYVLEAAAKASRNLGNNQEAMRIYQAGLAREPENKDLLIGYSYALSGADKTTQARDILNRLKKQFPNDTEVLFALAYANERRKAFADAMGNYDKILEISPLNKQAMKARIEDLRQLGAPYLAHQLALKNSELFNQNELKKYEGDKTAHHIRWGQDGDPIPQKRFDQTDKAIREILARKQDTSLSQKEKERAQYDLVQAFHDRFEMTRAIEEYEKIKSSGKTLKDIPTYVLMAAGEAYLRTRDPEKAREVLEEVRERSPQSYKNNILLYYAYQESEDHEIALGFINMIQESEPKWLMERIENPGRKEIEQTYAVSAFYSNMNGDAQEALEAFRDIAPANLEILRLLSDLYSARGLYRKALETAELGLALDPEHVSLRISKIQALMNLNRIEDAKEETAVLVQDYPENQGVQSLERDWNNFDKFEANGSFNSGESSGNTFGSKSTNFDIKVYTPTIANHYRLFARDVIEQGLFPEGKGRLYRQGAGLEYKDEDWVVEGEVDHNAYPTQRPSFRLAATYNPQDEWFYSAEAAYFTLDTPLRALKNGIFSNKLNSSVVYRRNEDFSAGFNQYIQNFTDRNLWGGLSGFVKKDVFALPKRKVDLRLDLATDFSRLTNVPYFSPKRALSSAISTSAVDRLWRRYENELNHRISLSGGTFSQKGFKTKYVGKIGYQHELKLNEQYELIYGVQRERNVYDGAPEYGNTVFINFNVRL